MPLKKSKGNMYPWVSHTHSHLGGACSHKCTYCYVPIITGRSSASAEKYSGTPRLLDGELSVKYGSGKTIFIEHMADCFAPDVPNALIEQIILHCAAYPSNTYVFQTKNPARMVSYISMMPPKVILGTTIETNRSIPEISQAPSPEERCSALRMIRATHPEIPVFVTIEPILRFDLHPLADWITAIKPEFVNIGADSKKCDLDEPTWDDVVALISTLTANGISIREKHNLDRLKSKTGP